VKIWAIAGVQSAPFIELLCQNPSTKRETIG